MPREAGHLAEENAGYEKSSRIESKRNHSWLIDTSEQEIFSNKKQAFQVVSDKPVSAVSHMNISQWDTNLGFHSITGQFSDRIFGSDLVRTVNSVDKNLSIGNGNLNMGMKDFGSQHNNDPSVGLSISHTIGGPSPSLNFGGIRKVKVNQVRDSDQCMFAASIGHPFSRSNNSTASIGSVYNNNDADITIGPTYNNENDTIVTEARMSKTDNNFVAMGHILNRGDGGLMLMGHNYGKEDENILSVGQPFDRRDGNFISVDQSYKKEDDNSISLGTSYSKGYESFISMGPTYGKSGESFTNVARSYDKGTDHFISVCQTYDKVDSNIASAVPLSFHTGNSSSIPLDQNHNKCQNNIISFGSFHDDPEPNTSGGIINSYDLLMGNQNSSQGVDSQNNLTESNPEPLVNSTAKPNAEIDAVLKNKEPKTAKKAPTNNFPSNVKSLLSTGIFDGVPVRYSTWSREVKRLLIVFVFIFWVLVSTNVFKISFVLIGRKVLRES